MDHVGRILQSRSCGRVRGAVRRHLALGVQAQHLVAGTGAELPCQVRLTEKDRDPGRPDDRGDPLGRGIPRQRRIGCTRLEHTPDRDHELHRPLHEDPHLYFGPRAAPAQLVGQTVGPPAKLTVAEPLLR